MEYPVTFLGMILRLSMYKAVFLNMSELSITSLDLTSIQPEGS